MPSPSNSRFYLILIAGCLACTAGSILYLQSSNTDDKAKTAALPQRKMAARKPVSRPMPSRSFQPSSQNEKRIRREATPPKPAPKQDPIGDSEPSQGAYDQGQEPVDTEFSHRFAQEETNRAWAKSSEQVIESMIERVSFPGLSIDNLECKSSVCKLELGYENELIDHNEFIANLESHLHEWEGEGSITTKVSPDGTKQSVAYFVAG